MIQEPKIILIMVTVTTKEQLKKAIEAKENHIVVEGELAKQLIKRRKVGIGTAIGGGAIGIGSLIAAPFTGGLSLFGIAGATALSEGAILGLAGIISVTGLGLVGIAKGYNLETEIAGQKLKLTRK